MTTLNGGLFAFYRDMQNQGLLSDTLVIQFSEFGRRISENGSNGTDHGAASLMMAMGGGVRGGIYGTAPSLNPNGNPTLSTAIRMSATKPISAGLRARHRQLARWRLDVDPGEFPERAELYLRYRRARRQRDHNGETEQRRYLCAACTRAAGRRRGRVDDGDQKH